MGACACLDSKSGKENAHRLPMEDSEVSLQGVAIVVHKQEIYTEVVDAIVNGAANPRLVHDHGMAAAIGRKAGEGMRRESIRWVEKNGALRSGEVAVTTAGEIEGVKFLLHVLGPLWVNG